MKTIINVTGYQSIPKITSNRNDDQIFFLDYNDIKEKESIHSLSICGTCGERDSDNAYGFCKNNHDNWIEVRDFFNENLDEHIKKACDNLGLNRDELITSIIWGL